MHEPKYDKQLRDCIAVRADAKPSRQQTKKTDRTEGQGDRVNACKYTQKHQSDEERQIDFSQERAALSSNHVRNGVGNHYAEDTCNQSNAKCVIEIEQVSWRKQLPVIFE